MSINWEVNEDANGIALKEEWIGRITDRKEKTTIGYQEIVIGSR